MIEPSRAVFLSYASQDAQAAQKICEALRAAGIEVWFDRSELRGGDARDTSIRKQSKSCALFIPAQDLLALNISLASVMQAGRWKDTRMPIRYAERVLGTRGWMAQAAKSQDKLSLLEHFALLSGRDSNCWTEAETVGRKGLYR
jgi:hypothetical protein